MQVAQLGVGVLLRYINSTHTIRHLCNGCFKRLFSRPSCIWNELQLEGVVIPPNNSRSSINRPPLTEICSNRLLPPPAPPVRPFSFDVTLTLVLFYGYFRNHVAIDKKVSFSSKLRFAPCELALKEVICLVFICSTADINQPQVLAVQTYE